MSNCMPSGVCDDIAYQLPNFNSVNVEVWERISNFTPYFIGNAITFKEDIEVKLCY